MAIEVHGTSAPEVEKQVPLSAQRSAIRRQTSRLRPASAWQAEVSESSAALVERRIVSDTLI
jgi:hypothetical protein